MINPTSTATLATSIPAVGGAHFASRATAARAPRAAASEGKGKGIFAVPRRARLVKTRAAADSARGKTLPGNGEDDRPFFDAKEAYDVSGYKNFKSRKELADAALLDRHWYPTNPESKTYQRTVRRSFTLVGVGLHSGEWETVRVCPARAGEGRYFVRVAPGTDRKKTIPKAERSLARGSPRRRPRTCSSSSFAACSTTTARMKARRSG